MSRRFALAAIGLAGILVICSGCGASSQVTALKSVRLERQPSGVFRRLFVEGQAPPGGECRLRVVLPNDARSNNQQVPLKADERGVVRHERSVPVFALTGNGLIHVTLRCEPGGTSATVTVDSRI